MEGGVAPHAVGVEREACAGFGVEETKEIAFAVASTDFSNRVHTIPAIPPRSFEELPDRLHMRLLRPLQPYPGHSHPNVPAGSNAYANASPMCLATLLHGLPNQIASATPPHP